MITGIYSITTDAERELLAKLAKQVPVGGVIVEIGALYGGVTAVLALSAPKAEVFTIDNFSWSPEGFPVSSRERLLDNMKAVGAKNVTVLEMTSKQAFKEWTNNIDLLWIDGGHDFKTVYHDLYNFSLFSRVIALHDYKNPIWPDIEQAIQVFLSSDPYWQLTNNVDMVAVLTNMKEV